MRRLQTLQTFWVRLPKQYKYSDIADYRMHGREIEFVYKGKECSITNHSGKWWFYDGERNIELCEFEDKRLLVEKVSVIVVEDKTIWVGFLFIVFLQCCVFTAVNRSQNVSYTIVFINFIAAVGICKCTGDLEAEFLQDGTWGQVILLNFVLTLLGMAARYVLEYGEVSNTYNFTCRNMLLHVVMMVLWSSVFWECRIREKKEK